MTKVPAQDVPWYLLLCLLGKESALPPLRNLPDNNSRRTASAVISRRTSISPRTEASRAVSTALPIQAVRLICPAKLVANHHARSTLFRGRSADDRPLTGGPPPLFEQEIR